MLRLLPVFMLPLLLCACGESVDKSDDTGETGDVSRDGTYSGTMTLGMTGGGGDGSCEVELALEVMEGGIPAVSGSTCCAVEGLSSHGDVDICLQLGGAIDGDLTITGDLSAFEQGDAASEPNGTWAGSFDADGALSGSGSGAMQHNIGSTAFDLLYDADFTLVRN